MRYEDYEFMALEDIIDELWFFTPNLTGLLISCIFMSNGQSLLGLLLWDMRLRQSNSGFGAFIGELDVDI